MGTSDTYRNPADLGLYYLNSRFYDAEIGRFVSVDTIDLVLASQTMLTDKNLYAYCDNNPISRRDSEGTAWETVFDIISLGSSIIEVSTNPYDVGAWMGLAGDVLDVALPFVAGVGETVRAVNVGRKIADTQDGVKDVVKTVGKVHGNSLKSNRINYGYQLIDKDSNVLKYGESKNSLTRYSKKWLNKNGYKVQIQVAGTKKGVHEWQHDMIVNYTIISGQKPKLNQSLW